VKRLRAALLLCVCLVLLCAAVRAADLPFSDAADVQHPAEVALLNDLGFVSGYSDGAFRPDNCVTRAEISKLITLIRTGEAVSGVSAFSDTASSWADPYIDYCAKSGIIAGYADGTFHPADYVTGRELAKMLLVAVNYSGRTYTGAGWSAAVDADAKSAGIYDNYSADPGRYATRDGACLMIYNALQCPAVQTRTAGVTAYVLDDMMSPMTVLESRFGVRQVTGVVDADAVCDLREPGGKLSGDYLHIDGYTREFVVSHSVAQDVSLIGRKVTAYAIFASDHNRMIGMPALRAAETYFTLPGTNGIDDLLSYAGLRLTPDTSYYENYNATTGSCLTNPPPGASVTVIDHEGDGKVDVVLVNTPAGAAVS